MERMNYSELVQAVLEKHTKNHLSEDTEKELVFDCQRNRYLLVHVGWEEGIANQLVELGVPKTDIVLGFRSPYVRQFTGFASV